MSYAQMGRAYERIYLTIYVLSCCGTVISLSKTSSSVGCSERQRRRGKAGIQGYLVYIEGYDGLFEDLGYD
jgi:hypothetical protein